MQTKFSVFAEEGSFSYNNILKTAEDFKDVNNTNLKIGNNFAVVKQIAGFFLCALAIVVVAGWITGGFTSANEEQGEQLQVVDMKSFGLCASPLI